MAEIDPKSAGTAQAAAAKATLLDSIFPKAVLGKFFKNTGQKSDIKLINVFLVLCILILGFYFVNFCSASLENMKNIEFKILEDMTEPSAARDGLGSKTVSFYTEKISERDIFRMGLKPKEPVFVEEPSSKAAEATASLKLVGISWSDQPDAIIEDTKLSYTFFVKKGSKIGEVKIEDIFKDRVVLSYEKELIELK
jgi:type II secretory pathway component PulC